jgi:hypothetical protein
MTDSIADLTFVTRMASGTLDLWTPERPDDYSQGCTMGRDYAAELLAFMRANNDATVFKGVLQALSRCGVWGAVEIGFCTHFGIALLDGKATWDPLPVCEEAAAAA